MGRGSSGAQKTANEPAGRRIGVKRFLENLQKENKDGMLEAAQNAPLNVGKAVFTKNNNALKSQEAVLESGEDKISLRFINKWEPSQVTAPDKPIRTSIEVVTYKNGDATAIRTLAETKTKSLKNAEKNYNQMLDKWKKLTKQRSITFA